MLLATDNRRDGNEWRSYTENGKSYFVIGFFDGMSLGNNMSYWGIRDKDKNSNSVVDVFEYYNDYLDNQFTNVTNAQIVDWLNEFYDDFRNRKIRIIFAVWLVVNEIAGEPKEEMEKMILDYRKNAD